MHVLRSAMYYKYCIVIFVKVLANGTILDLLSTMRKDNTG